MQTSRCYFFIILLFISCLASGCVPRPSGEVVVYCSVDREFAEPIFNAFNRSQDRIKISPQFDIESSKTLGLVTRIFGESNRPQCDIFWNSEVMHTIRLQNAGLLERRSWNIPKDWPSNCVASDGTWVGIGMRGRVLLVNKKLLPEKSTWPSSVFELADEKWKGKCSIAKPIYGTTATHMAILATHPKIFESRSDDFSGWFAKTRRNAVILSGNKQVAQAVSSGQIAWGLTDTDDARVEVDNGYAVEMIYPDQPLALDEFRSKAIDDKIEPMGMIGIPTTACQLKTAPHRLQATEAINYLFSQKTESRLVMGNAVEFTLWAENERSTNIQSTVASRKKPKLFDANFEVAAKSWDTLFEAWKIDFQ